MKIDWKTAWIYTIHILAGVTLGYILFSCKSSKSGCDAYSNTSYKYCIEGKIIYQNDTVDAVALTDLFIPFLTVNLFLYLYILNEINLIVCLTI